jgi:hypothetical protein
MAGALRYLPLHSWYGDRLEWVACRQSQPGEFRATYAHRRRQHAATKRRSTRRRTSPTIRRPVTEYGVSSRCSKQKSPE